MDITLIRDNSMALTFAVTNADGGAANLTGCTISLLCKNSITDANGVAVITKAIGAGITVTNPLTGMFTVQFVKTDTTGFTQAKLLHFDALITDALGNETTVAPGSTLTVKLNASR